MKVSVVFTIDKNAGHCLPKRSNISALINVLEKKTRLNYLGLKQYEKIDGGGVFVLELHFDAPLMNASCPACAAQGTEGEKMLTQIVSTARLLAFEYSQMMVMCQYSKSYIFSA